MEDNQILNKERGIDLTMIVDSLKRNVKLISSTTFAIFILSIFYGQIQQRTWKGSFQIVVSKNPLNSNNFFLGPKDVSVSGFNIFDRRTKLKTEIGILESPLVLNDSYLFTKNFFKKQTGKEYGTSFKLWKENIKTKLLKDTWILEVSYTSKNKNLILPLLGNISKNYQDFSNRERALFLDDSIIYFKNQIKEYKEKSEESFLKAENFANKNNLSFLISEGDKQEDKIIPSAPIKALQVNYQNQLREIKNQLKVFNEINNDDDKLLFLFASIPNLSKDEDGISEQLNDINNELVNLRSIYFEDDIAIKQAETKKEEIVANLKNEILNYLKFNETFLNSMIEANNRPEEVLAKYRQLVREVNINNKTLTELESQLNNLKLNKAQTIEPWELISNPVLLPSPIAPRKLRIAAIGLITGLLASIISAFYFDNRKNLLFGIDDLKQYLPFKYLISYLPIEKEVFAESLKLIYFSLKDEELKSIGLIDLTDTDNQNKSEFIKLFKKVFQKSDINISQNISKLLDSSKIIILVKSNTDKDLAKRLIDSIEISKLSILGWIYIDI